MNNRQKVIAQIVKNDLLLPWNLNVVKFRELRITNRKYIRDLDYGELITFKNLG